MNSLQVVDVQYDTQDVAPLPNNAPATAGFNYGAPLTLPMPATIFGQPAKNVIIAALILAAVVYFMQKKR